MYNILTLNKISQSGLDGFDTKKYNISDKIDSPDGVILRSFDMHSWELPESLNAVARAGAGVNNIPTDKCAEKGIVVFNTPGANANAVKEIVLAGLFLSSRKISEGINWANSLKGTDDVEGQVEKGKSSFGGFEIAGKKMGVLGLGAIGVLVANACVALGMEVIAYSIPLKANSKTPLNEKVELTPSIDKVFAESDYITIHIPATKETKNLINAENISKMKRNVRILNFARGNIVDDVAIVEALEKGAVGVYVTDFPNDKLLNVKNVVNIPHLGASTEESEENCAFMAVNSLVKYLEQGNIENSVNLPDCSLEFTGKKRVCVIFKNEDGISAKINEAIAKAGIKVVNSKEAFRNDYGYMIVDTENASECIKDEVLGVSGVIKVRVL